MGKGRPQQQEISRSGHTPVDQDSYEERGDAVVPPDEGRTGPVPPENRRHRPSKEQDRPEELGGAGHGPGKPRYKKR